MGPPQRYTLEKVVTTNSGNGDNRSNPGLQIGFNSSILSESTTRSVGPMDSMYILCRWFQADPKKIHMMLDCRVRLQWLQGNDPMHWRWSYWRAALGPHQAGLMLFVVCAHPTTGICGLYIFKWPKCRHSKSSNHESLWHTWSMRDKPTLYIY